LKFNILSISTFVIVVIDPAGISTSDIANARDCVNSTAGLKGHRCDFASRNLRD